MKQELDEKLCATFPLLYHDRFASMQQSAMCWGFPGDGWFDLLWELSSKLEPLIQKFIDENPNGYCECGCEKPMHDINGKCTSVFEADKWVDVPTPCHCAKFILSAPRASQVKEKYGTLRFYMTSSTKEMQTLITKAEHLSAETCEGCGGPGELTGTGWLTTLCAGCLKEKK